MRWSSAISDNADLAVAIRDATTEAIADLEGEPAHLAVVFVSTHHYGGFDLLPELLQPLLGDALLLGCSAGGVIGGGHEVEQRPGFSITLASLPGVEIAPFTVTDDELPNQDASPDAWATLVHTTPDANPHFVLLADPFSMRIDDLVVGLDYAFPLAAKVGGMASAGARSGVNALYLGDQVIKSGGVGVALTGNVAVDTVVAQGCRPIGEPMQITRCEHNALLEVAGRPPMEVLQELFSRANTHDQQLFSGSLFLGLVMDELASEYKLGDFLIRNLMGVDREHGAVYIGAMLREHQTVQFHLRDAGTASDDLRNMLGMYLAEHEPRHAEGALLFSCLGRGTGLFGAPDHDTDLFREFVGPVPLGGFFCNGEIGQVGGGTYVHGYTSSFGIFRPARRD
ncbi:MAG: hypothetical protein EXR52_00095 [Dehalococcoidia bacterium]|nr:hypothetical protein [Dehalococcoidia bacterium]